MLLNENPNLKGESMILKTNYNSSDYPELERIKKLDNPRQSSFLLVILKKAWHYWSMLVLGLGLFSLGYFWGAPIFFSFSHPWVGIPLTILIWLPIIQTEIEFKKKKLK